MDILIQNEISESDSIDSNECELFDKDLNSIILDPNILDPTKLKNNKKIKPALSDISYLLSVSVAESVTAGALSNTLCSEPGSSKFFLGGIVAYNMETQKTLLKVDAEYAEKYNFANPFTTYTMAKNVTEIFKSRIGLSTTGYSLPLFREENIDSGKCEINIKTPYAYICIYDSQNDYHKIYKIINNSYLANGNQKIQRAQMQSNIALKCKKIFNEYCKQVK
jgi:PncC family amidohydrolase